MRIPFLPTEGCCRVCGRAVEGLSGDYLCADCSGAFRPKFDRAASAVRFEGDARRLLLGYKFNRKLWLRDDFTDWLEATARAHFDIPAVDVVLPMPVTLWHRIDRGYNQCSYLARRLSMRIDRLCRQSALRRCGNPQRQSGLEESERRENVIGTFRVDRAELVRGRTVLLVDDVMTTGATLSAAAEALRAAGAWRVWCVTLARSVRG